MDKSYCRGCRNDFYNDPIAGKQCWSFKTAKVVWRIPIGHWENPPYKNKRKMRVPNCWHGEGPNRTHYIKSEELTSDGYWR